MLRFNIFPDSYTQNFFINEKGCWIWTGYTKAGIPVMAFKDEDERWRVWNVRSWIHLQITGKRLDSLFSKTRICGVDSTCGDDSCVNPLHLVRTTKSRNSGRLSTISFAELGKSSAEYRLSRQFCKNGHFRSSENRLRSGACLVCQREYRKENSAQRKVIAQKSLQKRKTEQEDWASFAISYLNEV